MTMIEIDPRLAPFMPKNGKLIELTARFFQTHNPEDEQASAQVAHEAAMYLAIQYHRILSAIAARAPEEGQVIATRQGLEQNFAKACFVNIAFLPEDRDDAARLIHGEIQRLATIPNLPMHHGSLEQSREGTLRVMPRQPK